MALEFDTLCQKGHDPAFPIFTASGGAVLMVHLDTPGQAFQMTNKLDATGPGFVDNLVSAADGYAHTSYTVVAPTGLWKAAIAAAPLPGDPHPPPFVDRVFATYDVYWENASPPGVPANYSPTLSLEAHRGDTVAQLNWTAAAKCDPRGAITSYKVNRSGVGVIATLPPTQLAYLDTGLNNASSYSYFVTARWDLPGLRYSGGSAPVVAGFNGNSNTVQLRGARESWGMLAVHRAL